MKCLSKYWVRSIHFKHLNGDTGGRKKPIKTMVFLEMISNDLPECCSNTCTTLMEALLTDGDISVNLINQPLPLAYNVKLNVLKQFSVSPILRIWMNLVNNVLTSGQEE